MAYSMGKKKLWFMGGIVRRFILAVVIEKALYAVWEGMVMQILSFSVADSWRESPPCVMVANEEEPLC